MPAHAAATAECAAEDRLEDVADIAEILRPAATAAAHALLERVVTEPVVGRALLRVFQAIVGNADRLEPRFRLGIAGIAVGMILHRQLAIGGFQLRTIGPAFHLEQFVKIDVGSSHYRPPVSISANKKRAAAPVGAAALFIRYVR